MPRAVVSGDYLLFDCPGCLESHGVQLSRWTWNGNVDRPSLSPSVHVRSPRVCHSHVRDGRIEYLGDCSHELAGRTVELPELES